MANGNIPVSVKATLKIEKYPEGTTDEQIKNGEVKPEEVVISQDDFNATQEQIDSLTNKKGE